MTKALHELDAFDEEGNLRMVVESPKGSTLKLKYEPLLGAFRIKRALPLGLAYPFDWGFIREGRMVIRSTLSQFMVPAPFQE